MDRKQEDIQFFQERGFGKTLGIGQNPCLIVVDMIKGFTEPSMPLGANLDDVIRNVNKFIDVCREQDIPVIFTTIAYEELIADDAGLWARKMEGLNTLISGTNATQIDPRLNKRDTDVVITKKYASAFFGTDLVTRLNVRKIDTLIVAGTTTSGCVRATVVDAIQFGFRPIVLSDGVGDRSRMSHEQSLFDMEQKYADVYTCDELIRCIKNNKTYQNHVQ